MTGITAFFKNTLGAELTNQQWSWGAENKKIGTYFLRAGFQNITGNETTSTGAVRLKIQLSYKARSHGEPERLRHIADILENKKPSYLVLLYGKDDHRGIFKPSGFDQERVFPIEEISYDYKTDTYSAWISQPVLISSILEQE